MHECLRAAPASKRAALDASVRKALSGAPLVVLADGSQCLPRHVYIECARNRHCAALRCYTFGYGSGFLHRNIEMPWGFCTCILGSHMIILGEIVQHCFVLESCPWAAKVTRHLEWTQASTSMDGNI